MKDSDDPAPVESNTEFPVENKPDSAVRDQITILMTKQPYAVLCTQGQEQPYGSVIAFAASKELNAVVFATPVATRKYRLLSECNRVAIVVDNRTDTPHDLSRIHALTATGRAVILQQNSAAAAWQKILIDKHPHMHDFICEPNTALVLIKIARYLHVSRLQEVYHWIPPHHAD